MAIGLFLMAGVWWVFEVMPIGVTAIAIGLFQVLFNRVLKLHGNAVSGF